MKNKFKCDVCGSNDSYETIQHILICNSCEYNKLMEQHFIEGYWENKFKDKVK